VAPRDGDVLFAAAQVASLSKRDAEALKHLEAAIQNGFSPSTARKDGVLARLQHDADFVRVTSAAR
jgi:hypothetical protein